MSPSSKPFARRAWGRSSIRQTCLGTARAAAVIPANRRQIADYLILGKAAARTDGLLPSDGLWIALV